MTKKLVFKDRYNGNKYLVQIVNKYDCLKCFRWTPGISHQYFNCARISEGLGPCGQSNATYFKFLKSKIIEP